MGGTNSKNKKQERTKSLSQINSTLIAQKDKYKETHQIEDFSVMINKLTNEAILPIENESIKPHEIILPNKKEEEKELMIVDNTLDDSSSDEIIPSERSKTFYPNVSFRFTPRPHPKESNEYISPLLLCAKSIGSIPKMSRRYNNIINDFHKDNVDSKSCINFSDESLYDFLLCSSETERTTPNKEDLEDLSNCRKMMYNFSISINNKVENDYENIFNIDDLFDYIINKSKHKKKKFWHKYIKQQELKVKNKINNNNDDFFILGILENAANERKGRKTIFV